MAGFSVTLTQKRRSDLHQSTTLQAAPGGTCRQAETEAGAYTAYMPCPQAHRRISDVSSLAIHTTFAEESHCENLQTRPACASHHAGRTSSAKTVPGPKPSCLLPSLGGGKGGSAGLGVLEEGGAATGTCTRC